MVTDINIALKSPNLEAAEIHKQSVTKDYVLELIAKMEYLHQQLPGEGFAVAMLGDFSQNIANYVNATDDVDAKKNLREEYQTVCKRCGMEPKDPQNLTVKDKAQHIADATKFDEITSNQVKAPTPNHDGPSI